MKLNDVFKNIIYVNPRKKLSEESGTIAFHLGYVVRQMEWEGVENYLAKQIWSINIVKAIKKRNFSILNGGVYYS